MSDFQIIAGIASITSLVISIIALVFVKNVKKIVKGGSVTAANSPGSIINTGQAVINYYEKVEEKLSNASTSLEMLNNEASGTAQSKEKRKTLHILSARLETFKEQYDKYRNVQQLAADSEKVITLLADISGIEFEIMELKREIGRTNQ